VVVPTFNYGHFVAQAVESVLAQTYRNVEVLVVDDGSTDQTAQALAPYEGRIRYIYQQNQGLSAARNTGIRAARGNWVALLDADDLWHPLKLEMQTRYVRQHPEVGLLASAVTTSIDAGWPAVDPHQWQAVEPITPAQLALCSRFGPSSVLVRKDCFGAVGLFDSALRCCEDRDMWLRIADRFPVFKLRQPLWWYRYHNNNMHRAAARMEAAELRVLERSFSRLRSLQGRTSLRAKAFSYAYFESAIRYTEAGLCSRSLVKLLRSLLVWCCPYRYAELRRPTQRYKMLLVLLLRKLHLKSNPYLEAAQGVPDKALPAAGTNGSPANRQGVVHFFQTADDTPRPTGSPSLSVTPVG
jgi:glycosyltransferase involved in cell wall biosynthesis